MTMMEKKLNNTNWELEKMSNEQLDKVVGGFMTLYIFLYANEGDHVTYFKNPIGIPAGANPGSWLVANYKFLQNHEKATASYSDFRKMCQDFADDNASQWKKPSTWGNLVMSAGMKDISQITSLTDMGINFERFCA